MMRGILGLFAAAHPPALASVPLEAAAPRYVSPAMEDLINAMNLGLETSEEEAVLRVLERFGDEVLRGVQIVGCGTELKRQRVARKIISRTAHAYFAQVDALRAEQGRGP